MYAVGWTQSTRPLFATEVVIFSPAKELRKTEAVMVKNLQAMQAG